MNLATGKKEFWKEFGANLASGITSVSAPRFSADMSAYAYSYNQILCEAYVVKGFK